MNTNKTTKTVPQLFISNVAQIDYSSGTTTIPGDDDTFWDEQPYFFIGIPKCASSIPPRHLIPHEKYLFHMFGRYYPEHVRPKLYSFVRNPYDRLVSAYFFFKRGGFSIPGVQYDHYQTISRGSFQEFVLSHVAKYAASTDVTETHAHEPLVPQWKWLMYPVKGGFRFVLPLNHVGRVETLAKDMYKFFGLVVASSTNATAGRGHFVEYFQNPDLADYVFHIYKRDFELFGYRRFRPCTSICRPLTGQEVATVFVHVPKDTPHDQAMFIAFVEHRQLYGFVNAQMMEKYKKNAWQFVLPPASREFQLFIGPSDVEKPSSVPVNLLRTDGLVRTKVGHVNFSMPDKQSSIFIASCSD